MPDLSAALWTLPGPNRFIQKAGQQMEDGFNLIILLPKLIDRSHFRQSLLNYLENDKHLNIQVIDLTYSNGCSPFEFLKAVFVSLQKYRMLEMAVNDPSLPSVILLDNLQACPVKNRAEWLIAIARWSDASSRCAGEHCFVLITDYQAVEGVKLPLADVKLAYDHCSGIPTALDVKMLCRIKAQRMDAENQWRENLLASLAGNDIDLAAELWDTILCEENEINQVLLDYANGMGWDPLKEKGRLNQWHPKPPGINISSITDQESLSLLNDGITVYTPEYGEEIHSAFLALLSRRNDIHHRIWRAQANIFLPLIDDVRRRICDYINQNGVEIKGYHFETPVELKDLKNYIDELDKQSYVRRQWEYGIKIALSSRNSLAHYETITYRSFSDFWRFYIGVHNVLFQLSN